MKQTVREMQQSKSIALVAHDNQKQQLLDWTNKHQDKLAKHKLLGTGTTGKLISGHIGREVQTLLSGPMGGDQQMGAMIAEGKIDLLIFFWDPLQQQPHDPDIKALLRIAAVWNIPVACNMASADFMINSNLLDSNYSHNVPDYADYINKRTS